MSATAGRLSRRALLRSGIAGVLCLGGGPRSSAESTSGLGARRTSQTPSTWPAVQADVAHTGVVATDVGRPLGTKWSTSISEPDYRDAIASAIVEDGIVYTGGVALEARSGTGKWSGEFEGTPAVGDGIVVAREFDSLVAFDAHDGEKQWSYTPDYGNDLNDYFQHCPVVDGDAVFAGTDNNSVNEGSRFVSVDLESGEERWTAKAYDGVNCTPTVGDETVYVDIGNSLQALDRSDGSTKWKLDIYGGTMSTLSDGQLYLGIGDGQFVRVDPTIQSKRWTVDVGSPVHTSPAVDEDRVYGATENGNVYALAKADGSTAWKREMDATFLGSPIVAGETLYIVRQDGTLLGLDRTSGETDVDLDVGAEARSAPALANDRLFVVKEGGGLVALGEQNAAPTAAFNYSPTTPTAGTEVSFSAADSSDEDGSIVSYEWDLDDDGTYEKAGSSIDHAFEQSGYPEVTLRVTDEEGASGTVRKEIEVVEANESPTAAFSISPEAPVAGREVQFDATPAGDPDGTITSYEWDIGADGSVEAEGQRLSYTFEEPGTYTVELRIRDDEGASHSRTKHVSVADRTTTITKTTTADTTTAAGQAGTATDASTTTLAGSETDTSTTSTDAGSDAASNTLTTTSASSRATARSALDRLIAGLLSTEALIALSTAVVIVMLVVTWEKRVD